MPSPTVARGRITIPSRSISLPFMFNPNEIHDGKRTFYGELEIPGASHPIYQFGAGGERLISFEIYLDGDRGRIGRGDAATTISIQKEILFYQSLLYPSEVDGVGIASVYPSTVLLTIGNLYRAVPCIVKQADVKITYFTPNFDPVRATVSLMFGELVNQSVTADQILAQVV